MICYQSLLSLNSIGVIPTPGESLLGDDKEGRTGGSLTQFTSLKSRGSWFTDIKKFVFPDHENKKVRHSVTVFEVNKITNG